MQFIDDALLDAVCGEAAASPRRRKNRNFHRHDEQPAHRLLNALQPDSYIPPHRHLHPDKDETMVVLRGQMALVEFDDCGNVVAVTKVGAGGTVHGVDIPHGTWHTVFALEPDTVFLEAKAGPYVPLCTGEQAPWAPAESSEESAAYLQRLKATFLAGVTC
jgi:cupin fold WbuC family metalloprotein